MTSVAPQAGSRVTIVDLLHSNARTRAYRGFLLGRSGVVINILTYGANALVKLDGSHHDLPIGVRRWSVHWDDLAIEPVTVTGEPPAPTYRAVISGPGPEAVLHAVFPGTSTSLCTGPVRPLPICDWSLPFVPTSPRACTRCAALVARGSAN
ncbi:hypothetical protein GCM10020216_023640 [Nonomuraea helvata]